MVKCGKEMSPWRQTSKQKVKIGLISKSTLEAEFRNLFNQVHFIVLFAALFLNASFFIVD